MGKIAYTILLLVILFGLMPWQYDRQGSGTWAKVLGVLALAGAIGWMWGLLE